MEGIMPAKPTVYLTPNFTLAEMIYSDTAVRQGIDNTPSDEIVANLTMLCDRLEMVRSLAGNVPLIVSSGYRCVELNRAIGSSDTSAHVQGLACDFTIPDYGWADEVCQLIMDNRDMIMYDQVIYEYDSWTHLGFSFSPPRMMALTINDSGTSEGIA
jgi:zinc D-Ala-D-Ala carboxypeptidase